MRIARVLGTVTMSKALPGLPGAQWLIAEALDAKALGGLDKQARRGAEMPESLVVLDQLGAARGALIAVSEGREAAAPFEPGRVAIDAYCAAILDTVEWEADA